MVKNPPANAGDASSIPGSEMAAHSSFLLWEILGTGEPEGGMGYSLWGRKVRHDLMTEPTCLPRWNVSSTRAGSLCFVPCCTTGIPWGMGTHLCMSGCLERPGPLNT